MRRTCHRHLLFHQDEVEVQAPPGNTIGFVRQIYEGCSICYAVTDAEGEVVLKLEGPSYCHCYCPGEDVPFNIKTADGAHEIGRVSKQWSSFVQQ